MKFTIVVALCLVSCVSANTACLSDPAAPVCDSECTNPQPKCESVCEEPLCDWKCHRPSECQKPKCAVEADASAAPKKCCGCDQGAGESGAVPAKEALFLHCTSKCEGDKDAAKCKSLCNDLKDLKL